MSNIKFELLEIENSEHILLSGCLLRNNSKKLILFIPGMGDSFFENTFTKEIMTRCENLGYDFLFAHNQGSFHAIHLREMRKDHTSRTITKGAMYERFSSCLSDLNAWFNYAEKNYEEIIVLTHSLGCNKTVYYLSKNKVDKISKIIFLAPQDSSVMHQLSIHEGMLEEARKNVKKGCPDQLLSKKFLGCFTMSSGTLLDFYENKHINNIPYIEENADYTMLKSISFPMLFIIGDKDAGEYSEIFMKRIVANVSMGEYAVIKNANHNFRGKEIELSNILFDYIKK